MIVTYTIEFCVQVLLRCNLPQDCAIRDEREISSTLRQGFWLSGYDRYSLIRIDHLPQDYISIHHIKFHESIYIDESFWDNSFFIFKIESNDNFHLEILDSNKRICFFVIHTPIEISFRFEE